MNKKYYANKMLLQDVNTNVSTIQDTQDKLYNEYKNNYEISLDEYSNKCKELNEKQQILFTMQEIIFNNFLHIQQKLLCELLEIYKNKYINSRIGEKTKDKIQNEFNNYILNKYEIECYCYINNKYNYNDENEIHISLYFKDFYYQYELKQEKIKYNKTTKESYLYYYNEIDYINTDKIEAQAIKLRQNYNKSMEKIKELKAQIEKIREDNNKNNKCCVKSTYINIKDI